MYCADSGKHFPFHVSCFRIADESDEEATYRVFKIGDISVLIDLKDLCRRFGLEWNFVSRRSGKTIAYIFCRLNFTTILVFQINR